MPNAGETVGSYELVRKLGAGAFGEVWLVRHLELGFARAMKIPTDPDYIKQLRKEGQIQFTLKHPNIVETFDLDTHHATPHLVMEYVEGEDLRKRLQARGKLPPAEALPIVRQILSALCAAHTQGVVHHDLKPENVLLAANGTVKVADFGLGRVQATVAQSLLLSGSMVSREGKSVSGTFEYMSPEQQQGEPADLRDDLHAIGVIACELLTGRRPTGLGVAKMFEREGLDQSLADAVEKALDDRAHAYASADQMLAAVAGAMAEKPPVLLEAIDEADQEKARSKAAEERRARAERRHGIENERRNQERKQAEASRQSRAQADAEHRRREAELQRELQAEQQRRRDREAELERVLLEREKRDAERARQEAQRQRPPAQPAVLAPVQGAQPKPPAKSSNKGGCGCLVLIACLVIAGMLRGSGSPLRKWIDSLQKQPPAPSPAPHLPRPPASRLVVVLRWQTPGADIDLGLGGPSQERCVKDEDKSSGPAAETCTIENPEPGVYQVNARYYHYSGSGFAPPVRVAAEIFFNGRLAAAWAAVLPGPGALVTVTTFTVPARGSY